MQIRIRRQDCCGSGECVEIAPDVFQIDSKQKSTVLDPDAASMQILRNAAEACPCSAIVLVDNEGNEVFP